MKRMQRKLIVIILALVMAVGLLPAVTLPAMALPAMNDASIGDTQYRNAGGSRHNSTKW